MGAIFCRLEENELLLYFIIYHLDILITLTYIHSLDGRFPWDETEE